MKLSKKSKLGSEVYKQLVVEKLIAQSLKRMCDSDSKSLNIKCIAHTICRNMRDLNSDYSILLSLHEKNRVKVGTSYLNDLATTDFT